MRGGGRSRDTWWIQEATEKEIRATLAEILREAKSRQRDKRAMQ